MSNYLKSSNRILRDGFFGFRSYKQYKFWKTKFEEYERKPNSITTVSAGKKLKETNDE